MSKAIKHPLSAPEVALRAAGLPRLHETDLMPISDAWALVSHVFPADVARYQTPEKAARALIGQNYKTSKTVEGIDAVVMGLSLAPHGMAGCGNLCAYATRDCRTACLEGSGHNVTAYAREIKVRRTVALTQYPAAFVSLLDYAVGVFAQNAQRAGVAPLVRLNVLSDIPWELFAPFLFSRHPGVRFYDYTKVPGRQTPSNYDLTFSYSGKNAEACAVELARGRRVAVVFNTGRGETLPREHLGRTVVDGDVSDLRPLDPGGVVVGLRYKRAAGVNLADVGPFVVDTNKRGLTVVGG